MTDQNRRWENKVTAARKSARENLDRELAEINLKVIESFDEPSYDEFGDDRLRASAMAKKRAEELGEEVEETEGD